MSRIKQEPFNCLFCCVLLVCWLINLRWQGRLHTNKQLTDCKVSSSIYFLQWVLKIWKTKSFSFHSHVHCMIFRNQVLFSNFCWALLVKFKYNCDSHEPELNFNWPFSSYPLYSLSKRTSKCSFHSVLNQTFPAFKSWHWNI